jgi:hypothetical protein
MPESLPRRHAGGESALAYLSSFPNDLFISYKHVANETRDRWVDALCGALESELRQLIDKVHIWHDAQLRGGEDWPEEIAKALDGAAIFLAVISRTYLDSDECRREFDRFLARMKDPDSGAMRKIVPILRHPPREDQQLPQELARFQQYMFYQPDKAPSPYFHELGPAAGGDLERQFWLTMAHLSQDLALTLEHLNGVARRKALGKVFLGSVGRELGSERERLRADLRQRGFIVVPECEYLWHADDCAERIAADLAGALLCVHLLPRSAPFDAETPRQARQQLEHARAAMRQAGGPAPMVWIRGADAIDDAWRGVIDYVENELANEGVEYATGSLEDFKTQILDRLPRPAPAPRAVRSVLLLVEEQELAELGGLKSLLAGRLQLEPQTVKLAGAMPRDAERLALALAACDACLVWWGARDEDWLQDVLALPALAPALGPGRAGIVLGAPASAEKAVFATTKASVIPSGDASEAALRALFGGATP